MSVSSVSSGQVPSQIQPQKQPIPPVKPVGRDSDGDNDAVRPDNDSDDAAKAAQTAALDSKIKAAQAAGSASQASGSARGSYVNITA